MGRGGDVCACIGVTPALQRRGSRRFPPCAVPRRALSLRGWASGEKFGQKLTGVSRVRPSAPLLPASACRVGAATNTSSWAPPGRLQSLGRRRGVTSLVYAENPQSRVGVWKKEGGPGSAPSHTSVTFPSTRPTTYTLSRPWSFGVLVSWPATPLLAFLLFPCSAGLSLCGLCTPGVEGFSPGLPAQAELQNLPVFSVLAKAPWPH